ncbi:hypothetical protein EVAR_52890_1, partial [Eumeta japonica]
GRRFAPLSFKVAPPVDVTPRRRQIAHGRGVRPPGPLWPHTWIGVPLQFREAAKLIKAFSRGSPESDEGKGILRIRR